LFAAGKRGDASVRLATALTPSIRPDSVVTASTPPLRRDPEHVLTCERRSICLPAWKLAALPCYMDPILGHPPITAAGGPLDAGAMVEHYRVTKLVGSGGMGEVYLARDTRLGRRVALKLVRPDTLGNHDAVQRFLFEAQVTARFNHPHIVTIYGVGEHEGRPYVALEYLEGQSLRERLQERSVGAKEAARIGLAIAEALVEAHGSEVLHRDLKPENVMVPPDGRLRVVDFGLAKAIDASAVDAMTVTLTAGRSAAHGEALFASEAGAIRGTPLYMAPEQWLCTTVGPASDVWALGLMLYEMLAGRLPYAGMPVFRLCAQVCSEAPVPWFEPSEALPSEVDAMMRQCLAKNPDERPSAGQAAAVLRGYVQGSAVLSAAEGSPFRGLLPFSEQHSGWFFGRDAEVEEFLERLRHETVLPVVGPSGAGKSSFVQAGVIPRLRERGPLVLLSLRPGEHPFQALASRLLRADSSITRSTPTTTSRANGDQDREAERDLAAALQSGSTSLAVELQKTADRTHAQVVLLVDQLEELYALVESRDTRRAFLEAICGSADDPSERVRVILTLRDDFLGKLAETPATQRMLGRITLLRSPGEDALREIVSRPVALAGYRYEEASLVDGMLAAVRGEPACLPLLQFACSQLWEGRDRTARVLRRATYESMGGVEGALARHADGVIEGMTAQQTREAKHVLLRLVTPESTRRAVKRATLIEGLGSDAAAVLDRLVESRVVVSRKGKAEAEQGEIELAHESLIRNWERLGRWIEDGREEIAFLAEAAQAAELWEKRGRPREEVWRGEALETARKRAGQTATLPNSVQHFLQACEKEALRGQRRKRALMVAGVALLGLVAAASLVVSLALRSREQTAVRERANAERKQAQALFEGARAAVERSDPIVARAQLRASLEIDDSLAARALWPSARQPASMWSIDLGSPLVAVSALRDGKSVAVAGETDGFLVDLTTLEVRRMPELGYAYYLDACPDGSSLAVGHSDGRVTVLQVPGGGERMLGRLDGTVRSVACSGDGRFVIASGAKEVRAWELGGKGESKTVGPCESRCPVAASAHDLAYSSGDSLYVRALVSEGPPSLLASRAGGFARLRMDTAGKTLAAQCPDGTVTAWDMDTRRVRSTNPWNPTSVSALAMNPQGSVMGTCDGFECAVWNGTTGVALARGVLPPIPFPRSSDFVPEQGALVFAPDSGKQLYVWPWATDRLRRLYFGNPGTAAFSPSGSEVASTGQGTGSAIRAVSTGRITRVLPGRSYSAAYDLAGTRLIVGSLDGLVQVWDVRTGQRLGSVSAHRGQVDKIAAHPNRDLLASSGSDGRVRLLSPATMELVGAPMQHFAMAFSVAFHPDGSKLASASWDRTVRVWDVQTQKLDRTLPINDLGMVASFSPDGTLLASSMRGGDGVALWRTADWGRVETPPLPGPNNVYGLAFHPDGERLVLGPTDAVGRIWNFRTGHTVELIGHHNGLNTVAFSADGRLVITTSDDETTRTWDTETGHPFWRAPLTLPSPPRALTQQGWLDLAETSAAPKPLETRWARAVHEHAREASADSPLTHVCIRSHERELRIWDTVADRESHVVPLPGLAHVMATPTGCAVLAKDEARLVTTAGASTLLASGATAIAVDHGEVLVASGQEVLAFDSSAKRVATWQSGSNVSAMARIGDWLVVGRNGGQLALVPLAPGKPAGATSFEGIQAVPVLTIVEGPRGTIVAGYQNGAVGVWDPVTGRRLDVWYLHGPAIHVLVDGTTLYAVSELADTLKEDLSVLERDYCDLMREVWKIVPVVWEAGKAVKREPPAGHKCRM